MRVDERNGGGEFEVLWREHRPFLVDLAFRMLGNIGDAEDVVQDAFARLLRADLGTIEDVRGWLVVVVSRRCLDVLRSARVRRDGRTARPVDGGDGAGTEVGPAADTPDPADRVTLDDSVRMALLVVLEKLTPAERAAFVLHDVFRYPFNEVAAILGRPVDACRKLASRGRHRVEAAGGPARFDVEPAAHRLIAERFIAACAGGDLGALLELLDADVAGQVDVGFGDAPVPVQVGRERVAANLLRFFNGASGITLVSQSMNGWPGVLAFKDGRLYALVTLELRDGRIGDIHAVRNRLTLAAVGELVEARR
jgi:RNA polymerase sigma-70 factor (ECF subfamily)